MDQELDGHYSQAPVKLDLTPPRYQSRRLRSSRPAPACRPARLGAAALRLRAPTSREKRVTRETPAGESSKPLQEPLCGHGDPRDPSPWNRMAFSGKGSQWARNSHHYVQSLPRESPVSLLRALADPRAASRGGPRPHALPESQSAHSPWQKPASLLWLSITLSLPAGRTDLYFSTKKNPLPWLPPDFPFPLIRPQPKEGRSSSLIL